MAFFTTVESPATKQMAIFYNVDWAVGVCPFNKPPDVKLVQALMHLFYYVHQKTNGGYNAPEGSTGIKVDGLMGPVTRRHILHFQQQIKKKLGANVKLDGRLDPFRKHYLTTSASGFSYMLSALNQVCHVACRKAKSEDMNTLWAQPYVANHGDLVYALELYKEVADQYTVGGYT